MGHLKLSCNTFPFYLLSSRNLIWPSVGLGPALNVSLSCLFSLLHNNENAVLGLLVMMIRWKRIMMMRTKWKNFAETSQSQNHAITDISLVLYYFSLSKQKCRCEYWEWGHPRHRHRHRHHYYNSRNIHPTAFSCIPYSVDRSKVNH